MDETVDYIGERYPDLTDADLRSLHEIGIRFCKPAIAHGATTAKTMESMETMESTETMEPMEETSVA